MKYSPMGFILCRENSYFKIKNSMKNTVLNTGLMVVAMMAMTLVGCDKNEGSNAAENGEDKQLASIDDKKPHPVVEHSGKLEADQLSPAEPETPTRPAGEAGAIKFKEIVYDFGTIEEGDAIKKEFAFSIEGEFPVIINRVQTSCGCTVSKFDQKDKPLSPGTESSIELTFNSKGKSGSQKKVATVYSDAQESQMKLTLIGTVVAAGQGPVKPAGSN